MTFKQIETTITALSHDGRGIASHENKTIFVSGALPGEKVICQVTRQHRRYNEAQTVQVLSPAADRTEPKCPHFHYCGGCSMQHIENQAQVLLKQQTLLEQLAHIGKAVPQKILPPLVGEPWNYRGKARLGVRYVKKKEKILVGFREKCSNYLADIEECSILHPSVGTRLRKLREVIQSLHQYEHIPQIEVAVGDQATALVIRHMQDLPLTDKQKLSRFGEENNLHIFLYPSPPASIYKIWPEDSQMYLSYFLPEYQLEMQFHPLDFTQVNAELNRHMIKQALHLLEPTPQDLILDLFCGLGNFTLPLARHAKHVIGIEGSEQMVRRASDNARLNQIDNATFYAANLMEPHADAPWLKHSYDKILLDPPRTGAKEIIPFIATHKTVKKIAYVSCNPATLARDTYELVHQFKYQLTQAGVINMFPHTSHIEAIALFEKK